MMSKREGWKLVAAAIVLAASGCVYESFEEPVTFFPSTNNNNDAGMTNNMSTGNNATTPDMGMTTPVDMGNPNNTTPDMGMDEPWRCRRKTIANDALVNGEVQIEPLEDGNWVAAFPIGLTESRVVTFDSEGNELSSQSFGALTETTQRVELLTDGTDHHWIWLSTSSGVRYVECTGTNCDSGQNSSGGLVSSVDGFWNGGEEVPHVMWFSTGNGAIVRAFVASNGAEPGIAGSNVSAASWVSLALTAIPPNPTLTSPISAVVVDGNDSISMFVRRDTSETVDRPLIACNELSGNVGKAVALTNRSEALADIQDEGDVVIARLVCGTSATRVTDPVSGLRDWASIVTTGRIRTFHVSNSAGLELSEYDGRVTKISMEADPFDLVDAAQHPDTGEIAVVTVDGDGLVQLRTMNSSGVCN